MQQDVEKNKKKSDRRLSKFGRGAGEEMAQAIEASADVSKRISKRFAELPEGVKDQPETPEKSARASALAPQCKQCKKWGEGVKTSWCPCRLVAYCSRECQRVDWPAHKAVCKTIRKDRSEKIDVNPDANPDANPGSVYVFPLPILSKDPDDAEMRCGVLSFCNQTDGGRWLGFTVFQLFTKTWSPDAANLEKLFDPRAEVKGKTCYELAWKSARRADKTTDASLVEIKGRIGTVVKALPELNQVVILLDRAFTRRRDFREQGHWMRVAGV
jgi:hypothetical protein